VLIGGATSSPAGSQGHDGCPPQHGQSSSDFACSSPSGVFDNVAVALRVQGVEARAEAPRFHRPCAWSACKTHLGLPSEPVYGEQQRIAVAGRGQQPAHPPGRRADGQFDADGTDILDFSRRSTAKDDSVNDHDKELIRRFAARRSLQDGKLKGRTAMRRLPARYFVKGGHNCGKYKTRTCSSLTASACLSHFGCFPGLVQ